MLKGFWLEAEEMEEEWRDIPEYDGVYQVSNVGDVRSFSAWKKGTNLVPWKTNSGYLEVQLFDADHNGRKEYIHALVLVAFRGDRPSDMTCNHIDGNKLNNRLDNLEYCTQAENNTHKYRVLKATPVAVRGSSNKNSKLTEADVASIREMYSAGGTSMEKLASMFGVSDSNILAIIQRKTWRHIS